MSRSAQVQFTSDKDSHQFDLELECGSTFSQHRTRSGLVYPNHSSTNRKSRSKLDRRAVRHLELAVDGDVADCEENGYDSEENSSLPLYDATNNFTKIREKRYQHDIPSSPARQSSPVKPSSPCQPFKSSPKNENSYFEDISSSLSSLDLLDILTSPSKGFSLSSLKFSSSAPKSHRSRLGLTCSRLRFDSDGDLLPSSCPLPSNRSSADVNQFKIAANVNPFTPQAMLEATKRKSSLSHSYSTSSWLMSQSDNSTPESSMSLADDSEQETSLPAKRIKMSDISITRYQDEFLEMANIATGQFGKVIKARHRLDGITYAIKISKNNLRANSYDEKMAMNEVFAHAALMKHKHVVRYFNSWIERGQIYIQTEFCEFGSLDEKIGGFRVSGQSFPEEELRRLLLQVGKGLKYIHSRKLVHLDIKPGNILIAMDPDYDPAYVQLGMSSDSGAASTGGMLSGTGVPQFQLNGSVLYKIGDLGHMNSIEGGDITPTEGDCRYMAPEFMQMDPVQSVHLPKADMFSTGMTIYEAATLRRLPRNSEDSADYESLKRGILTPFPNCSKEFFSLICSLVHPQPSQRLSSSKLVCNHLINPIATKSKTQLWRELNQTKAKLLKLEQQLSSDKELSTSRK